MKRYGYCLAVGALLTAGVALAGGEREEQLRLKGDWVVVASGRVNKQVTGKNRPATIAGDKMTVSPKTEWALKLYPTRNPPEIDLHILAGASEGKVMKGIYKLEGDTLTICYSPAITGDVRPASFAEAEKGNFMRMILKRKPAPPEARP
jgi:uncharacterized protein (TIGR03067 family)